MTYPLRIGLPLLCVAVALVGCNRDDGSIRTYAAPKDIAPQAVAGDGQSTTGAPDPDSASTPALHWKLPAGWTQTGGASEMRYATIEVAPGAQLTITPLGAEAGALLPNIQRWAGQLGIANVTEADLPKYAQTSQISGEQAQLVDITGTAANDKSASRLLAAIIPHDGRVWFIKLTAPDSVAAVQKSNFDAFVHSLQFTTARSTDSLSSAAPSQPTDPSAGVPGHGQGTFRLASWKTPEGWTEQPGANAMRVTSFRVGTGGETAEVIVSRIPQDNVGPFVDNINRWRGQVGLDPITEVKPGEFKKTVVAAHEALLLTYTGPQKQMLVALDVEGSDYWFVKLLGPTSVVSRQQDAFNQFLVSMQFVPETK